MKRDQENGPGTPFDRQLDQQLDRLTGTLRDAGIPPERDLWPGIDEAISKVDNIPSTSSRTLAGWRIAALAASLLLLVGVGTLQLGGNNTIMDGSVAPLARVEFPSDESSPSQTSGMKELDGALADLNQALANDPNNRSLSKLVLMIHKSRGNLIRNSAKRLVGPLSP